MNNKKVIFKKHFSDGSVSDLGNVTIARTDVYSKLQKEFTRLNNGENEFKLRLKLNNVEFDIVPICRDKQHSADCEESEHKKKYDSLTKREKGILCFLYRGYKQSSIAFIMDISINTYRQHRNHLYEKMGFASKFHLMQWCDIYLKSFFRINP